VAIGLVIVSHSEKIAAGVVELAAQMAAGVHIEAAGGTDDGGIGTSFDKVTDAIAAADSGDGVVVLCDLGSAILTAETAIDFLDDDVISRVRIADAPLVEGAVAAAVAAEVGGSLDEVLAAAESANQTVSEATGSDAPAHTAPAPATEPGVVFGTATLINASGLHARPAADFVRLASTFDASIRINGVEAKSLLKIMSLGLGKGTKIELEAHGPQAQEAVTALRELIGSGFGE